MPPSRSRLPDFRLATLAAIALFVLSLASVALADRGRGRGGRDVIRCGTVAAGKSGCNVYGCWKNSGGCNVYGCWNGRAGSCNVYGCSDVGACNVYGCPDGEAPIETRRVCRRADSTAGKTCNVYGCYAAGGGCNVYGCWQTRGGSCNVYGCSDAGACNVYGCP